MSIGMMLISVELLMMLFILLFIPGDYAGPCFIGFAIGESLGAAALRIAGGIFTKIADIGSDLMKIVFKIKEDDARNPGRDRGLHRRQRRRFGRAERRRIRDLRRYGRRADHLHPAGRQESNRAGAIAGVDFRDAHRHAGGQRRGLLHQRRHRQGALWQRRQNELRDAAHLAGLAHFDHFHRDDLCDLRRHHSEFWATTPRSGGSWRRSSPAEPLPAPSFRNW